MPRLVDWPSSLDYDENVETTTTTRQTITVFLIWTLKTCIVFIIKRDKIVNLECLSFA